MLPHCEIAALLDLDVVMANMSIPLLHALYEFNFTGMRSRRHTCTAAVHAAVSCSCCALSIHASPLLPADPAVIAIAADPDAEHNYVESPVDGQKHLFDNTGFVVFRNRCAAAAPGGETTRCRLHVPASAGARMQEILALHATPAVNQLPAPSLTVRRPRTYQILSQWLNCSIGGVSGCEEYLAGWPCDQGAWSK